MSTTPPTARPPAASTGGHQARASPNRHQRPTRDDAIHRRAHPGRPSNTPLDDRPLFIERVPQPGQTMMEIHEGTAAGACRAPG
jgi:hypothetical protein